MLEEKNLDLPKKKDQREGRFQFLVDICIKGSEDLIKILNIDEDQYNLVHHRMVAKSRNYFLYAAMNEVERSGMSLLRTDEFMDGKEILVTDRQTRNILQVVKEEQSLWIRRMTELLTELILFSKTNENSYYRHYMLVKELKSLKDIIKNAKVAYGCEIQNYKRQLENITQEIIDLEASKVDIQKCWYLATSGKKGRVSGVKGKLSTLDERINGAFELASPDQVIALGTSFEEGYGNLSSAMHFNPTAGNRHDISSQAIQVNISGIGILAANIIIQARFLLKDRRRKKGFAVFITKIFKASNEAQIALDRHTKPDIKKGDFVDAQGELAEVTKIMKGKYGFRSFHLKFLLKEDTEVAGSGELKTIWTHQNPEFEEYPAMWIRKLYSKKVIANGIKAELLKHDSKANVRTQRLTPFIRESVIHLWKNAGLKESVHGKRDQALEKMKEELERLKKRRKDAQAKPSISP